MWKSGRIVLRQLSLERMQLLFGGGRRQPGFEPQDREHAALVARIHSQRQPQPITRPPPESRRHDTDDRMHLVVQAECLANGVGVAAEEALPQLKAQYDHRFGFAAGANVGRLNRATYERRNAEKIECIPRQSDSPQTFRSKVAGQKYAVRASRHHVGEA